MLIPVMWCQTPDIGYQSCDESIHYTDADPLIPHTCHVMCAHYHPHCRLVSSRSRTRTHRCPQTSQTETDRVTRFVVCCFALPCTLTFTLYMMRSAQIILSTLIVLHYYTEKPAGTQGFGRVQILTPRLLPQTRRLARWLPVEAVDLYHIFTDHIATIMYISNYSKIYFNIFHLF